MLEQYLVAVDLFGDSKEFSWLKSLPAWVSWNFLFHLGIFLGFIRVGYISIGMIIYCIIALFVCNWSLKRDKCFPWSRTFQVIVLIFYAYVVLLRPISVGWKFILREIYYRTCYLISYLRIFSTDQKLHHPWLQHRLWYDQSLLFRMIVSLTFPT